MTGRAPARPTGSAVSAPRGSERPHVAVFWHAPEGGPRGGRPADPAGPCTVSGPASSRAVLAAVHGLGLLAGRRGDTRARVFVGALVAAASYEPVRRLVREQRAAETEEFRELARTTLAATFLALPLRDELARELVGLHAFVVQWPLRPGGAPYLGPVARFRLGAKPPSSGIVWAEGVGAVGEAWRLRRPVAVELAADPPTPQEWEDVPSHERLRLGYNEYLRLGAYYGAVVATPILVDDEPRGVVALDMVPGTPIDALASEDVLGLLDEAALILGQILADADPDPYPGPGVVTTARLVARAVAKRRVGGGTGDEADG